MANRKWLEENDHSPVLRKYSGIFLRFIENNEILLSGVDCMIDLQLSWPPKKKYDSRRLVNNIANVVFELCEYLSKIKYNSSFEFKLY